MGFEARVSPHAGGACRRVTALWLHTHL